ncbi:hypothetical protein AB2F57_25850 (plasmid) [Escherichia coli]
MPPVMQRRWYRSCDDGADRWSGVVCRKIITPFLARDFFPVFYACHLAVLGVLAL